MALDLSKIASQVSGMAARLRERNHDWQRRVKDALEALGAQAGQADRLRRKVAASRTTWLVAEPLEDPAESFPAPPTPADFTVAGVDGSHVDVDRHRSTRCYVINLGSARLRYGCQAAAELESTPRLYADDEELVIADPSQPGREQPVEGALLGIRRSVEECRRLVELAGGLPPDEPALLLMDGSLIMWSLEPYPDYVGEALLEHGYLACLEELKKAAADRPLALASYISYPRSTDVVNALRVAVCPREVVDSDRCRDCTTRECDGLKGVRDRDIFASWLQPGQRSALFLSSSRILERYGPHRVCFFYLMSGDEMARVEVPQWVTADRSRLDLVHALVLDQCRRGQGYPVALSEAHELAVIRAADVDNFWRLVEASLVEEHLPVSGSAKSRSKRTRWV